jgi:hypothetical protein
MRIPSIITAGDSPTWVDNSFSRSDGTPVSAPTWSLTYTFRGPVAAGNLSLPGTAQGSGWLFALTAAETAAFNATPANAVWYWQAVASMGGQNVTAGDGQLTVKAGVALLSAGVAYDGRSPAEVVLANIEKEISSRISGGASVEYSIGTRSLKRETLSALMSLRSQYRLIVARERTSQAIANGLGNPGRLGVRFK